MKIIISHDVDHLTLWEHFPKDLIIPKFFLRSYIEFLYKKINYKELLFRHADIFVNKWNNIEEILNFNKDKGIKSTFFFGMNNALGLSYNYLNTKNKIDFILSNDFEVGLHGISFDNDLEMKIEYNRFKHISGLNNFGIRMHYLRKDSNTLDILTNIGYDFDSSTTLFTKSYLHKKLYEFPIHIMDSWILNGDNKFQSLNFKQATEKTKIIINCAINQNVDYFSLLFHDCYFSNRYQTWKDWYIWTIEYLLEMKFDFVTYSEAIKEIKIKNT